MEASRDEQCGANRFVYSAAWWRRFVGAKRILVASVTLIFSDRLGAGFNCSSTTVPLTLQIPGPILRVVTVRLTDDAGESQAKVRAPRCVPISYRPHVCGYLTLV